MTHLPSGWRDGPPPAHWTPTPLGSNGNQPPLGPSPPPRPKAPWIIGFAVIVLAALIAITASWQPWNSGAPAAKESPSATPAATKPPGHPFTTANGAVTGRWDIREHHWTADGVEVEIWLSVDEGIFSSDFVAFVNTDNDSEVIYPYPSPGRPILNDSPMSAGEERGGWLLFPTRRTDVTIIMTTQTGRQVSALVVRG